MSRYRLNEPKRELTIYERLDRVGRLIEEIRSSGSKDDLAAFAARAESEIRKAQAQLLDLDESLARIS